MWLSPMQQVVLGAVLGLRTHKTMSSRSECHHGAVMCRLEQKPVCAGCQQTRYGCRLPSICRGVTQCLKTKVTTLFFSSRCNALHPRNGSLPSIAYRELPLQLTPVACTVFSDTELALVRHVAVGLGVLYDGAKGPNLS